MRINAKLKKASIGATILTLTVFGYLYYQDFIYDGAGAVEQKLLEQTAQISNPAAVAKAAPTSVEIGLKRAQLALQEFKKGVYEIPARSNSGPEINKYTEGHAAQWCTMFASWVTAQAGSPVKNAKDTSWRITNSRDFADYLKNNGTWYDREQIIAEDLQPQIGDFVIYYRGDYEDKLGHVDVVVDVGDRQGYASLVGGNLDDTIKYRENFNYQDYYGFLGFGRPEK